MLEISDYATWSANADLACNQADDDHDGLNNFSEYAFGIDPKSGASSHPVTLEANPSVSLRYTRRNPALTRLTYSVWYSANLTEWHREGRAAKRFRHGWRCANRRGHPIARAAFRTQTVPANPGWEKLDSLIPMKPIQLIIFSLVGSSEDNEKIPETKERRSIRPTNGSPPSGRKPLPIRGKKTHTQLIMPPLILATSALHAAGPLDVHKITWTTPSQGFGGLHAALRPPRRGGECLGPGRCDLAVSRPQWCL